MKPRFSICIPVWEQGGYGLQYLKDLIHSIQTQSFKNWEIVVSDHSKDDHIYKFLTDLYRRNERIQIRYEKYSENYGNGVTNLNNALKMANGKIIKIMFQDDFMFDRRCLEKFDKAFQDENTKWAVCGCNHTRDGVNFERFMVPSWNDKLLEGVNTISSPSVLAFRNENVELFDEKLTMLMDTEYYYRLYKKYGHPYIISDTLITNRQHQNQISSRYDKDINLEIDYVRRKYIMDVA